MRAEGGEGTGRQGTTTPETDAAPFSHPLPSSPSSRGVRGETPRTTGRRAPQSVLFYHSRRRLKSLTPAHRPPRLPAHWLAAIAGGVGRVFLGGREARRTPRGPRAGSERSYAARVCSLCFTHRPPTARLDLTVERAHPAGGERALIVLSERTVVPTGGPRVVFFALRWPVPVVPRSGKQQDDHGGRAGGVPSRDLWFARFQIALSNTDKRRKPHRSIRGTGSAGALLTLFLMCVGRSSPVPNNNNLSFIIVITIDLSVYLARPHRW